MRTYRIIYEKTETREVWVEVPDNVDEAGAEKIFEDNFVKYDDESDEHDCDSGVMNVLMVDEIDENGDEL